MTKPNPNKKPTPNIATTFEVGCWPRGRSRYRYRLLGTYLHAYTLMVPKRPPADA